MDSKLQPYRLANREQWCSHSLGELFYVVRYFFVCIPSHGSEFLLSDGLAWVDSHDDSLWYREYIQSLVCAPAISARKGRYNRIDTVTILQVHRKARRMTNSRN